MADLKDRMKGGMDKAADAAQTAKQEGQNIAERAKDAAQGLVDRAGDVAGQARDKVQEWAGSARETAQHAGEKAQKWVGEAYDATADSLGDFGREVSSLVRKHPVPALLISFGVGLLLGRAARMV